MDNHERVARVESVDMETGRFEMTLATEGEASDGDILSIAGGQIPKRMPMLISHFNDPTATAGSVIEAKKELSSSPPRLRAVGQIEMSGEGALADVRRDIAMMINKGHVTGVSIRWDEVEGKPPVRRVNLPSDHPYFVDAEKEKSFRKRYGLFWQSWSAREGSIVALGADTKALIGRADETRGEVSEFWRHMARESSDREAAAQLEAAIAALRVQGRLTAAAGANSADLINAVLEGTNTEPDDIEAYELKGRTFFLPADLVHELRAAQSVERAAPPLPAVTVPAPTPSSLTLDAAALLSPANIDRLGSLIMRSFDSYESRIKNITQSILDQRRGKV